MNNKLIEKILFNKYILFIICFFILSECCYFDFNLKLSRIIKILSYGVAAAVTLLYFMRMKMSKFTLSFVIYSIMLIISCAMGEYSAVKNFIRIYHGIIAIVLLLDVGIRYDSKTVINVLEKVLFILVAINFTTILIYPNGLYETSLYSNNWFLQYDNLHIMVYFPAILVSLINNNLKNRKNSIITILLFLMISYSVFYCFSANTTFAYSVFIIYTIFGTLIDKSRIFNARSYFLAFIVMFLSIVVFRVQKVFSWLIVDIFHKNLTFTGRTYIWDTVLMYIKEKPFLGYGLENSGIYSLKLGSPYYAHAHNTIYDIIYKGGIISLIAFIYMMSIPIKKLYQNKDNKIAKTTAFILLCLFIMMNFEARQEKLGLYIILTIGANVDFLIKSQKTSNA